MLTVSFYYGTAAVTDKGKKKTTPKKTIQKKPPALFLPNQQDNEVINSEKTEQLFLFN